MTKFKYVYIWGCHKNMGLQRPNEKRGIVVWDFKEQEGNSYGDGKANICWSVFNNETQRRL